MFELRGEVRQGEVWFVIPAQCLCVSSVSYISDKSRTDWCPGFEEQRIGHIVVFFLVILVMFISATMFSGMTMKRLKEIKGRTNQRPHIERVICSVCYYFLQDKNIFFEGVTVLKRRPDSSRTPQLQFRPSVSRTSSRMLLPVSFTAGWTTQGDSRLVSSLVRCLAQGHTDNQPSGWGQPALPPELSRPDAYRREETKSTKQLLCSQGSAAWWKRHEHVSNTAHSLVVNSQVSQILRTSHWLPGRGLTLGKLWVRYEQTVAQQSRCKHTHWFGES